MHVEQDKARQQGEGARTPGLDRTGVTVVRRGEGGVGGGLGNLHDGISFFSLQEQLYEAMDEAMKTK